MTLDNGPGPMSSAISGTKNGHPLFTGLMGSGKWAVLGRFG